MTRRQSRAQRALGSDAIVRVYESRLRRRSLIATLALGISVVVGVLAGLGPAAARPLSVARDTGQVLVSPPEYALVHRTPPEDFAPSAAYQWLEVLLVSREVASTAPCVLRQRARP